ncbi:MAG: putative hydrogenase cytochrome b-type subunit protein [Rhodospirillales bacterium]|jgi:cytochrome b|nr:putative hydrogenase cytochrome b-type subunit protein [Rhodospirillales bacterium]MDB5383552.1 putative hydrogenase cytochrome b-type subunit protein [Rhodospirillales bacterium]
MDRAWRYVVVWDGWVRMFHWSVVLLIMLSYFTARAGNWKLHFFSGYSILALVLFRLAWGLFGSESARFGSFIRSPVRVYSYLRDMRTPGSDTHVTHNPAGAWMVVAMLVILLSQVGTGLIADPDDFVVRGPFARMVDSTISYSAYGLHARNFILLLTAIGLHVAAIIAYRVFKGHNLLVAMLTGRKKLPYDIAEPRATSMLRGAVIFAVIAGAVFALSRFGAAA